MRAMPKTRPPQRKAKPQVAPASEPGEGARSHPLGGGKAAANELEVAYETIPEAERRTWYERAEQQLAAAGMPSWLRIVPTVKEAALRLWVGTTIPGLAAG